MIDTFGIGQAACARIAMDLAQAEMGAVALYAFGARYSESAARGMMRERFAAARGEYEAAKAVLESVNE